MDTFSAFSSLSLYSADSPFVNTDHINHHFSNVNVYQWNIEKMNTESFWLEKKNQIHQKLAPLISNASRKGRINDEGYADILRNLHEIVDEGLSRALNVAGFEAISRYSIYPDSAAKDKVVTLHAWSKPSSLHSDDVQTIPPASPHLHQNSTQLAINHNYQKLCQVGDFPEFGRNDNYLIATERGHKLDIQQTVEKMIAKSRRKVVGIDLGTGHGKVPEALNKRFGDKVMVYGVTAQTPLAPDHPPQHIIYGNIEDLPGIRALNTKKVDFFVSCHAFPYLGDALKVISDAYAMLNEGGVLLLDHVYIHIPDLGDAFFEYLRSQGYDIIAQLNDANRGTWRGDWWGPGFVFIRKNHIARLEFPVGRQQWRDIEHPYRWDPANHDCAEVRLKVLSYKINYDLINYAAYNSARRSLPSPRKIADLHERKLKEWFG